MGKEERRRVGGFGLRGAFGASEGAAAGCGSGGGGRWVLTIVFCCRCCRQQPACLLGIRQPAFSVNVYFLCCLMIRNCKKGEGFGAVFGEISRLLKTIPRTDIVTPPPPSLSTGPGFFRRWGGGGDVLGCCIAAVAVVGVRDRRRLNSLELLSYSTSSSAAAATTPKKKCCSSFKLRVRHRSHSPLPP